MNEEKTAIQQFVEYCNELQMGLWSVEEVHQRIQEYQLNNAELFVEGEAKRGQGLFDAMKAQVEAILQYAEINALPPKAEVTLAKNAAYAYRRENLEEVKLSDSGEPSKVFYDSMLHKAKGNMDIGLSPSSWPLFLDVFWGKQRAALRYTVDIFCHAKT